MGIPYLGGQHYNYNSKPINTPIPKKGDRVVINNQQFILGEPKFEGGEGIIYKSAGSTLIKIFNKESLTTEKKEKIEYLISLVQRGELNHPSISWPTYVVKNMQGQFVGYVMKRVDGIPLEKLIFSDENEFRSVVPNFYREHIVKLCYNLSRLMEYLHSHNIIVGDLSEKNILFNRTEPFLIDVDSFQIGKYPSLVGTTFINCPERVNGQRSNLYMTFEEECYNFAIILFKILMMGMSPFMQKHNKDTFEQRMVKKCFPYGTVGNLNDHYVPDNIRTRVWTHLPIFIIRPFVNTFHFKGNGQRLNPKQWSSRFFAYLLLYTSKKLDNVDYHCHEVFPSVTLNRFDNRISNSCLNDFDFHKIIQSSKRR